MSKKILAVVLALVMVFSVMLPMTIATAATGNWGEISYQIIDGEIKITAITDASYNRLALFYADDTALSSCLETTNSYVEDGDNRVWTITVSSELAIPGEFDTELKSFVIRGRDAATNTYKAGGISDSFEVMPESIFMSYSVETKAGKVVVTADTTAYANKIIVVSATTGEILGYDGTAGVCDWDETAKSWTVSFPYDENDTSYIIKARDERTGKYNKNDIAEVEAWEAPAEPVISVEYEDYDEDNLIVRVTTIWGLYRVKIAYADDAAGYIAYAREAAAQDEDWNDVWEFIIAKPEVTTEYAIDVAYDERAYEKYYYSFEIPVEVPVTEAPEFFAENAANTITDGWYTTTDGLVQIYVGDWVYYGSYGLTLVASYTAPVDAATIAVYAADSDEVFAAKTADDFAAVLGETVNSFEAVTIAGEYAGYIAKTATYTNLVFQANGSKYFINYINADDGIAIDDVAARAFENIVVCKPAPAPEANTVADGWYTTSDALVQMYVGDWVYYGAYGLTLVAAMTAPVDAATIAVYAADSDEVFAAKTADDFAAVLGETVDEFTAVTIAGQYPGYIAKTATYLNLVFQANGSKYFINYINADDGIAIDNAFNAVVNSIIVYEPAVEECTHENTTTTTVDATCTEDGSVTVTCECGEVISTEVIPATGHENTTEVPAQDATCTEAGWVDIVCDACSETVGGYEIPATGHGETTTNVTTEPTCGTAGNEQIVCNDCNVVLEENEIPATGEHTYAWEITSMPAIDVAGEKTYTCGVCGDTYTEEIAAIAAPTSAEANTVAGTWYTTTDGLVQLYVDDWSYYGSYGLTLVKNPAAYPTSAATIAVYTADSDEVFAAKTADDFAAVLGETVNSFEAVTIAGQYPGYIAYTATYRNLVFQANGAKYFINVIAAEGEADICEELFQIMAANVIVYTPCTHENTTTTTTVDATCGADGLATTTCDDCGEVVSEEVISATGEHTYAWEILYMPGIDAAGEKIFTCDVCGDTYTEEIAAIAAPTSAEANTVAGTWYTTTDGLVQLYVADWMYYGQYGLTLVKSASIPTSAATIAVYAADSDEVFAAKTADDFASVLQEDVTYFASTTIAGQYPGYIAYTASYRNLVFQANGAKYFINIIALAEELDACEELFQIMMANVIVNEPAVCEHANTTVVETVAGTYNTKGTGNVVCDDCGEVVEADVATAYVAPAEELWNTVTEDGWYIFADGKVAMNVGSWVYYGSYGLTLVGAAGVVPIDAAAIAIYDADSDEVFAAKTADDFASVLQEDVTSFEAVEICGYPGYIAKTASYRNLVFQANGYKYFINYMVVDGDSANVDSEADFAIAVESLIVY